MYEDPQIENLSYRRGLIGKTYYLLTTNSTARDKIDIIFPLKTFRYIIIDMETNEFHQSKLRPNKVNHFGSIGLNRFS